MRTHCFRLFGLILMLGVFTKSGVSHVRSIQAQTKEGVIVTVWVDEQQIRKGKDVEVKFKIENKGSQTTYLVMKERLEFEVANDEITVNPFTVGADEYGPTDYSFSPLRKGASYQSKFIIPAQKIESDGVLLVDVEFAFVNDIERLQPRDPLNSDPVAFRGPLSRRAIRIKLGQLFLLVE